MTGLVLAIGNKNYSSWSMRPWLALRWGGLAFAEQLVPLGPRDGKPNPAILALSDSGRVPVLTLADGTRLHESLAICEWAAEQVPGLWPADPVLRALGRSAAAEMHAGFAALRRELPMNLRRRKLDHTITAAAEADIARIEALWQDLRARSASLGPWLCGTRSVVDAMYAPVATRFRTYGTACRRSVRPGAIRYWQIRTFRLGTKPPQPKPGPSRRPTPPDPIPWGFQHRRLRPTY